MSLADPLRGQTVICTLGMHRSGTSLASRMLNLLGVHLGPHASVSGKADDNPKGFWEHHPLALLNDEIIHLFGGRWDAPPEFAPSWPRDPRLEDIRERARQLLTDDFGTEPLWGWKDPRTCLTLPFWQELVGSIRYVMCIRNPCAVVASLRLRNGMSAVKAERLWLTHVQSALAHTSGQPRMFVFYEDIIREWSPELRRMAAFIGHPERAEDPGVRGSVAEFLEEELCHHRMSIEDLAADQQISFATKSLYLTLRGHAPRDTPEVGTFDLDRAGRGVQRALDLIGAQSLETLDRTVAVAAERDILYRDNEALGAIFGVLSAERSRSVAECHELAARENRLLQSIETLESDLRGITLERDGLARESEAARQALQRIHASGAWRLIAFSRHVMAGLLPPGTRRRRVVNAVVRRIAHRADDADFRTA